MQSVSMNWEASGLDPEAVHDAHQIQSVKHSLSVVGHINSCWTHNRLTHASSTKSINAGVVQNRQGTTHIWPLSPY